MEGSLALSLVLDCTFEYPVAVTFFNKKIVLGVSSSVAIYRALELVRLFKKEGANVHVVMSSHAAQLISPQLFHAVSGNRVWVHSFDSYSSEPMAHVSILQEADLFMVAPATANTIGKLAMGLADDLLTTTLLASKAPILMAPSMNTAMFEHPIVQENIQKLKSIGITFAQPEAGLLACGAEGVGRLAPLETILWMAERLMTAPILKGKQVLISAGRTEEPLDPVRVLTNRSSGKMGLALVRAAYSAGAQVTVVSGTVDVLWPSIPELNVIHAESADTMKRILLDCFPSADIFISAAAICDYKPCYYSLSKLKQKTHEPFFLELDPNDSLIEAISKFKKSHQVIVNFALETEALLENAERKRRRFNADLCVANGPEVLNKDRGHFHLITARDHRSLELSKQELGEIVLTAAVQLKKA